MGQQASTLQFLAPHVKHRAAHFQYTSKGSVPACKAGMLRQCIVYLNIVSRWYDERVQAGLASGHQGHPANERL